MADVRLSLRCPRWACTGDRIHIAVQFHNTGSEAVYINRRCAMGHLASGADLWLRVFGNSEAPLPTRSRFYGPPTAEDFLRLPAGHRILGGVYDLSWDYELPVGEYRVQVSMLESDTIPEELVMESVWLPRRFDFPESGLAVLNWGEPPPSPRPRRDGSRA